MANKHQEIDRIYSLLGISNTEKIPRNVLNKGSMNRRLNTNCSTLMGKAQSTAWSNSAK